MSRDTFDMFAPPDRGRFGDNESESIRGNDSVRSDLIDLTLQLRQDRPLSLMVSDPAKGFQAKWIALPKSLIEYETDGAMVTVTLPESLAKDKGLI